MNRQLARIEQEYQANSARLDALERDVPEHRWTVRPGEDRWSVAECVAHLNLTSEAFLPDLQREVMAAAAAGTPRDPDRRYRRDPMGWFLSVMMPPPVRRMRVKTTPPFVPRNGQPPAELVRRFRDLQEEQVALLRDADGLPLDRMKIQSPFSERASYNAYSCFVILVRHQHRHLWQAAQAAAALEAGAATSPTA